MYENLDFSTRIWQKIWEMCEKPEICEIGWLDFQKSGRRSKQLFLGLCIVHQSSQKKFEPNRSSNFLSQPFLKFGKSLKKRKNKPQISG